MKRKLSVLLATAVVVAGVLAGCGGGAAPASSAAKPASSAASSAAPATSAAPAASSAAASKTARPAGTWDSFNEFYAGVTDSKDVYMLLAFGGEGKTGAVIFLDTSSAQSGSWVGNTTTEGNTITVSDQENGTSLTFSVEEQNGGYLLDMGDVGQAFVGEVEKAAFVSAVEEIDAGTTPQF